MHIVGIGLSNIDLIAHVGDDFLARHDLIKGQAQKLKTSHFLQLREELRDVKIEAGGCVGNTLCGMDKEIVKATFFGKIGNDIYAKTYRKSFQNYDVLFPVENAQSASSQCAVLITPDGERSFAYIHGASWTLSPDDIYFDTLKQADLIYTEIYALAFGMKTGLWPALMNYLRSAKRPMAMKVVDQEYVDLYRMAIFGLAEEGILGLLIGNAANMCRLARRDNIADALSVFKQWKCAVLITDAAGGAYFQDGNIYHHHPVAVIETPINSSGAGDQFMAGFLEGWMTQSPIPAAMKQGEEKARAVLMSDSPRP